MDKNKYIQDLAWELKLTENTTQEVIAERLSNLWDIAEVQGQMKLNKMPEPKIYQEYNLGDTPKCPLCHFSLQENHSCIENITDFNC